MTRKAIGAFAILLLTGAFIGSCKKDSSGVIDTGSGSDSDAVATGSCGDGVKNGSEVCDGGSVGCETLGRYHIGLTTCLADCAGYDLSKCVERDPGDRCGNGVVEKEYYEVCEIGDTKACNEINPIYAEGTYATCADNCRQFDIAPCSAVGNDTCSQIFDCVTACGDESCKEECIAGGSATGKERYEALMNCFEQNCASGADIKECTEETCPTDYYNCFPTEKCGNGTVDEGEMCEKNQTKDCGEIDPEKYRAGKEAICNSVCTGYDTYMCIPKDALTCYEVYLCIEECGSDTACQDACTAKSYADAMTRLDTMLTCYEEQCNNTDNGCYDEKCQFQTDACKTHATCGDGVIDQYELCEKGDKKDCGRVDPNKYEAGTADATCNTNCTRWSTIWCYGFCSCQEVYNCVEQECGGQATTDYDCVDTCMSVGSSEGKPNYKAWRQFITSCCETDQQGNPTKCGFESQACIDKANQDIGCAAGDNPKCPY